MEPDHSATIKATLEKYKGITIVCNDKILTMAKLKDIVAHVD